MRSFFSLILVLIFFAVLPARISHAFTASFGMNALQAGMGDASVCLFNTPQVLFSNPAGFAGIERSHVSIDYNLLMTGMENNQDLTSADGYFPVDMKSWSASFITPASGVGGLGISFASLSFTGLASYSRLGVSFSGFLPLPKEQGMRLSYGITGKYLFGNFSPEQYTEQYFQEVNSKFSGFSADFGLQLFLKEGIGFGLSIQDFVSSDMGIAYEDMAHRRVMGGVLYPFQFGSKKEFGLMLLVDFDYVPGFANIKGGVEFEYKGVKLRAGANLLSIGMGLGYSFMEIFSIDYAVSHNISGLDGFVLDHKLSFGMVF